MRTLLTASDGGVCDGAAGSGRREVPARLPISLPIAISLVDGQGQLVQVNQWQPSTCSACPDIDDMKGFRLFDDPNIPMT